MKSLSAEFLTAEEQKKITRIVQHMEKQTSGEIVPMVVSASHDYPMAKAIGGALLSLPLALLLTSFTGSYLWLGSQNMWLFLIYAGFLYYPMHLLVASSPFLKRLFLLNSQVEEEVEEAAITSFFLERLYLTKNKNGILLFISVLEKKVWVLADSGINNRVGPDEWEETIEELSEGIRDKRQCEAMCKAISQMGEVLRHHFPIEEDDHDELHNLIIR